MPASPFFTPADTMRAMVHLSKPHAVVLLTMHSGEVKKLVAIDQEQQHGRVSGTIAGDFQYTFDPERVEGFAFTFDPGSLFDVPDLEPDQLLLAKKEADTVQLLLASVESGDLAHARERAEELRQVHDDIRALLAPEPSQLSRDRPGEFGGYEGAAPPSMPATDHPAQPESVLDEPDVGKPQVIDHPRRRGRPPKRG